MTDLRGSVIADSAGTVTNVNKYADYGAPDAANVGRFLETDPIGYGDGMNIYAYVGNDR